MSGIPSKLNKQFIKIDNQNETILITKIHLTSNWHYTFVLYNSPTIVLYRTRRLSILFKQNLVCIIGRHLEDIYSHVHQVK